MIGELSLSRVYFRNKTNRGNFQVLVQLPWITGGRYKGINEHRINLIPHKIKSQIFTFSIPGQKKPNTNKKPLNNIHGAEGRDISKAKSVVP